MPVLPLLFMQDLRAFKQDFSGSDDGLWGDPRYCECSLFDIMIGDSGNVFDPLCFSPGNLEVRDKL